jgi:hypothetical protein
MLPPFVYLILCGLCLFFTAIVAFYGNTKYKEYKKEKASSPAPVDKNTKTS